MKVETYTHRMSNSPRQQHRLVQAAKGSDRCMICPAILIVASLLQSFSPVGEDADRLTYLLRHFVQQYLLTIRGDIVEKDLAGHVGVQFLRRPKLQCLVAFLHAD